jgi:hypothetical protein
MRAPGACSLFSAASAAELPEPPLGARRQKGASARDTPFRDYDDPWAKPQPISATVSGLQLTFHQIRMSDESLLVTAAAIAAVGSPVSGGIGIVTQFRSGVPEPVRPDRSPWRVGGARLTGEYRT